MSTKQELPITCNNESPKTEIESSHPRPPGRRIFRILLSMIVLTAGVFTAFWLMETSPQAKPHPRSRSATLVEVRTVEYSPQQTVIPGMGTVAAASYVELKPQVNGKIIEMSRNLAPGGHFRRGETLLKIDPTDYRLAVRQLATDVAKAESELQLEQGNQLVAQKEYQLLGETVSDTEKALMLRQPQLENLRATLEAAQAKLEQARVDLARTQIKAPFNAVVQSRDVNLGTRANETTVLATLVGIDAYWVEVSAPVSQLRWIQIPHTDGNKGSLVRIYDSAAWGDGIYRQGRVIRLEADIEEQGRMARLLVQVDDPLCLQSANTGQPRMLIGSYVRVEIEGQAVASAAAIEREFIRDGNSVWVMTPEGSLEIRPVEITFRGIDRLMVTGGIDPGEQMVISDLAAPITGMPLRTTEDIAGQVTRFINRVYSPFLDICLRWRTLTVALGLAILLVVVSYALSGRIGLIMMPRIESDTAEVTAVLPVGSPMDKVKTVRERLSDAMQAVAAENGGEQLLKGVFSKISENKVEVKAYLTDAGVRPLSTGEVTQLWRAKLGPVVGLESLLFESDGGGPGSGAALTVELSHTDIHILDQASAALADRLAEFPHVKDIDDGYTPGKQQLDFSIKPEGQSLGLTSAEVARQVRSAFSGAEALRQQRGRNEVTVRVRLPKSERTSEYHVEQLMIRTPAGIFVPLIEIAEVQRGRAYTSISRRDARRTVTVSANVEPIGETAQIQSALNRTLLPELARNYPGLAYGYQGRQADMKESMQSLIGGFSLAMLAIYFLLAIPFRSYTQPLIVMVAIPFGVVGAILGHLLMGYNLSLMSMMGVVALSGVVVNDSLVLIDYANRRQLEGAGPMKAIRVAGLRRFRPIVLTTLTTFGGLAPMIFETSRQARFMIPMALSLGFGILFATVITLILAPCLYLLLEDMHQWLGHGEPCFTIQNDALLS